MTFALLALLAPAVAHADRSEIGSPRLMEGPMVGAPLEGELRVWARLSGPYAFSIRYADNPQMEGARESYEVRASEAGDYAVVTRAKGIEPDRDYWYVTVIDGARPKYEKDKLPYRTRSAPQGGAQFSVAFGSCARVMEDPRQPIWQSVAAARPDLFFWLGDNIYGDTLYPQFLAEEYRKQRSVSGLQTLLRSVPQLATWDDHDYGLNDHDRENPIKEEALALFRAYWANPSYGEASSPGVYFKYAYGGVDFLFLDGRYYRAPYDDPDDGSKTMLGERQLEWLKEELSISRSPFKVLVSGSGWTSLKGPHGDSWAAFLTERDALFAWIAEKEIEGVILLSGDTHRGELNCIPWSEKGGYDLYEFVSSPLSQDTSSKPSVDMWEVAIEKPYTGATNFGLLQFDLKREDPRLTFRLVNQYGMEPYDALALKASQLRNGVSSWKEFVSEEEVRRHEKWQSDGGRRGKAADTTRGGGLTASKRESRDVSLDRLAPEAKGMKERVLHRFAAPEARQGVAVDEDHVFVISNHSIGKYERGSFKKVASWECPEGRPLTHLNAGIVLEGKLYCAHSNYPGVPMTSSLEVWDTETLAHMETRSFGPMIGSLTWVDRRNGSWYACFAHYANRAGEPNRDPSWTALVRFDANWQRQEAWVFPPKLVERFGNYSSSGGAFGPDGRLYVTGHDNQALYVMELPKGGSTLEWVGTIPIAAEGQAFAWDPFEPWTLYSIVKRERTVIVSRIEQDRGRGHDR